VFDRLTTTQQVLNNWDFLYEGLLSLNETASGGTRMVPPAEYLKLMLNQVARGEEECLLSIGRSKNGKPLAYGFCFDTTTFSYNRTYVVYAYYCRRGAGHSVTRAMLEYSEEWGKKHGYNEAHTFSQRLSSNAFRLFEGVWKFRRTSVLFVKKL
jgi:hypothetical protein